MEIPVINRFSGLESGMSSLPNPTLLPQILTSPSGFQTLSRSLDLWKWSAVIIAVVATFSGVINRIKLLFVIFRRQKRILQEIVYDSDSDTEYSVDDSASSVSSVWSEFEEDDVDEPASSSSFSWDLTDQDFHVRGSDYYLNDDKTKQTLRLRHRRSFHNQDGEGEQFSWADFTGGKSVVKLWDNLRFEFDHCDSDTNEIRVHDVIKEQTIGSILAGKSQIAPSLTSTLLLSTTTNVSSKTSVNIWDTRMGCQIPALIAEWKPVAGKVLGVKFSGEQKVYLRNESGEKITVGDVRNMKSPLENLTAADMETWFDADAVMVSAE
ncbi:uncharacterized protein LOC105435585 [Cucumis sativus]|uniref:Uncharacterized protein n=1 Tax=Cucumis sativus TaxID=3659 RepID=A0A0A0KR50_CUCSA|nr:uncharacterized protein LOC105435585 [Cucumis sativus]KGN52090.1 hypothetical protein Csa_008073 [Cucumis sativus]